MVRKRYSDSPTRSAELLRLALPLMSRQSAPPHPLSYSVWYEHVSGRNRALSEAIAALTAGGQPLDDDQTVQLYDTHVLDAEEQSALRVAEGVRGLLNVMSDSAQRAGSETKAFDASLQRWNKHIAGGQSIDPHALTQVLSETQKMRTSMGELTSQLASNQTEIERLRREIDRARDEALIDSLTGLANRRAFSLAIARCMDATDSDACLIICDIDHFKRINDSFGHLFGDQVLRVVSKAIESCLEGNQHAARVGGEEFAILLPAFALTQAMNVAEQIRATVEASRIRRRESNETIGQVTISLGIAIKAAGDSADDWYERADQALYISKQSGRNQATVAAAPATVSREPAATTD